MDTGYGSEEDGERRESDCVTLNFHGRIKFLEFEHAPYGDVNTSDSHETDYTILLELSNYPMFANSPLSPIIPINPLRGAHSASAVSGATMQGQTQNAVRARLTKTPGGRLMKVSTQIPPAIALRAMVPPDPVVSALV